MCVSRGIPHVRLEAVRMCVSRGIPHVRLERHSARAADDTFSEKPYLLWGVIQLFLLLLNESDFSTFQKHFLPYKSYGVNPLI